MSFEIKTIEVFDRQAKRLAKHYASFKQDYKDFLDELRKNPLTCQSTISQSRVLLLITKSNALCNWQKRYKNNVEP